MNTIRSISLQKFQLLIGLLIGLFVLTQTTVTSEVEVQKDSQEESGKTSHTDQIKVSEAVTSSGPQINLGFQSFLLQEVELNTDGEDKSSPLELLVPPAKKALKVLFRRIISPNAP